MKITHIGMKNRQFAGCKLDAKETTLLLKFIDVTKVDHFFTSGFSEEEMKTILSWREQLGKMIP
jgi:hypothetical protein